MRRLLLCLGISATVGGLVAACGLPGIAIFGAGYFALNVSWHWLVVYPVHEALYRDRPDVFEA